MKTLVTILLAMMAIPAIAQERQFDIELIVFKRTIDPEQTNESWPTVLDDINVTNLGTFDNSAYREQKGVTLRPYTEYQLLSQVDKLKKHAGFEVLLHQVWRQGDQGKASAPKFRIRGGRDYSSSFYANGSEKNGFSSVGEDGSIVETTIDQPLYELDGVLQVYVQHYLFLETTLDLKAPGVREITLTDQELVLSDVETDGAVQIGNLESVSPTVQEERFLKRYRMDQKRRMRSSETHYLDHPLMGIIVQVRRVEEAKPTTD